MVSLIGFRLALDRPTLAVLVPALVVCLAAGIAGVYFTSHASAAKNRPSPKGDQAPAVGGEQHLNRLVTKLQEFNTNSELVDVGRVLDWIDAELSADLSAFLDLQGSLRLRLDEAAFDLLIRRFKEGQRNIGDARSASMQGSAEAVWDSLGAAEDRMTEAYRLLVDGLQARFQHPSRN